MKNRENRKDVSKYNLMVIVNDTIGKIINISNSGLLISVLDVMPEYITLKNKDKQVKAKVKTYKYNKGVYTYGIQYLRGGKKFREYLNKLYHENKRER